MHLKNRILAILAVVGVVALMCYFGTKEMKPLQEPVEEENSEEVVVVEEKKDTLHFWYSDESMSDYINSAAVAFGEKYDTRVFPHLVSDSAYLEAINYATLHEEQAPDAYLISHDSLEKAYLSGLAAIVMDAKGLLSTNTFPQTALDAVTYQGKQVAYPLYFETTALLYNETYLQEWARQQAVKEAESLELELDEATLQARQEEIMTGAVPATMDDILSIADSFDPPETVEIFKWDVSDIFYNYYMVGNYMNVGGDCGDDKSNININNPEAVSCLEVYKALNQFFYIESETVSYESVIQDFIDGKLVFTIATTDAIATIEAAKAEGRFGYEYGVSLMPHPSEELLGRSLSVTGTVAVNGYSERQELANAFAQFLTDEYVQELYTRSGRVAANQKANADNEALQFFKEEYAYSISLPKMMETGNFWVQLEILFSKVWNGEDVATLVAELAAQIQSQVTPVQ